MRRLRSHLTYANVVATLALVIAVGGGAAYAANTVFSSDIADGEVRNVDLAANSVGTAKIADGSVKNADLSTGASSSNTIADGGVLSVDVRDNNLTGADLLESSLGKVPDADTLDGKDSTSFMEGRALYNRVVQPDTGGFTGDILVVPGFGKVYGGCDPTGAQTIFNNTTPDPIHVWVDDGSGDPVGAPVVPGGGGSTTIPTDPKALDLVTFQVGRGTAADADFRLATIVVTSSWNGDQCIYQAQAVAQSK